MFSRNIHRLNSVIYLQNIVASFRKRVMLMNCLLLMVSPAQLKKNPKSILAPHGAPAAAPPFVNWKPNALVKYNISEF